MTKRTTRITFENERLLVIRQPSSRARRWCAVCGDDVQVVTAEDAAIIADRALAAIHHEVETTRLHTAEDSGQMLICLNSLLKLK